MSETIKIPKDLAQELVDCYEFYEGYKTVDDEHIEDSRWSASHYLVIQRESDGKLFGASYSTGLTEMQEERPFEYDGPEIEFREVEAYEETITSYREK